MRIAIYGIYQGQSCLYVGQSVFPKSRFKQHRLKGFRGMAVDMRVLRYCDSRNANRIERQVSVAYWKRGEAMMSKHGRIPRSEAQMAASRANGLKARNAPIKARRLRRIAFLSQH